MEIPSSLRWIYSSLNRLLLLPFNFMPYSSLKQGVLTWQKCIASFLHRYHKEDGKHGSTGGPWSLSDSGASQTYQGNRALVEQHFTFLWLPGSNIPKP